ncbi:hypothetical protein [Psychrosphaera haliotis]|uniref:Uncharacterized protein n=1 Tax=Psychrosphaera haliotis TaxID=555083 RepID=A0A6N8F7H3_9GAMM|nr:hypothetical protein [Psychrosphaera haliotis]MDB2373293.1 hypothetical protein [Psychrosphaera haliotis]MUH72188.1 hypothetical protein [Psychrosphaera haliotis]
MAFSQVLLSDVTANKETNQAILEMLDINEAHDLQYHVYEVAFGDKQIFCCLSGGVIENNEIQFTPVGLAAFEALTNIKEMPEAEYFADFINTEKNIAEQIETVFARVPNGAKVCFVGDITGELKEELSKFFTMIH